VVNKPVPSISKGTGVVMKHIPAHYDGEKVVLDKPVSLSANTPVEVVIPDSEEELAVLRADTSLASLPSLMQILNNPRDAEYDKL
jgi:PII-like signaling protein